MNLYFFFSFDFIIYLQILGHSDIILKVSWCKANEFIVSGGEDCYYKVSNT